MKLKTYANASKVAQKLNIKSSAEYRKRYKEDTALPANPSTIFSDVWKDKGGWKGFLGKTYAPEKSRYMSRYKTFKEASRAVKKLKIKNFTEYKNRYKEDKLLTSYPKKTYSEEWEKNGGYIGFFGEENYNTKENYNSYEKAASVARKLNFNSVRNYIAKCKEYDSRLPLSPKEKYPEFSRNGGWGNYLGIGEKHIDFAQAKEILIKNNITSQYKYRKFRHTQEGAKLPSKPMVTYAQNWKGWEHFLAGNIEKQGKSKAK